MNGFPNECILDCFSLLFLIATHTIPNRLNTNTLETKPSATPIGSDVVKPRDVVRDSWPTKWVRVSPLCTPFWYLFRTSNLEAVSGFSPTEFFREKCP